jgi:hypothetical protein
MEVKKVDVFLSIEVNQEVMRAHLTFTNITPSKLHLDTWAMFVDNKVAKDYFYITDENNCAVKYIGMMVKRIFKKEDFIEIDAGEKVTACIDLEKDYRIEKGKKYSVRYSTFHPSTLEGGIMKLESNTVSVVY